ncbi:unnamed protein product [Phytophthora fragariaefolia]|uniref:Unnamed protein product n=1 Tax=Phytophthora fragariaefolia TaxID=1490495 RepID=A0A9W6TX58_9STRA|nr:unnamed protein product [Phytophthora fragariaefolia]
MKRRLKFCAGHVDLSSMLFNAMEDIIHMDEKLFNMTTVKRRYVLLPDEAVLARRVHSKRHIPKVMILAAVARPRTDPRNGAFFDDNIGRAAGTLVPKAQYVNKSTYREMLVERVLPAIGTKWPGATSGERIVIQQDNAPPHIAPNDAALRAAVTASGCNVDLRFQPPNSPDLNAHDLTVFNAIQARQQLEPASTVDELMANVKRLRGAPRFNAERSVLDATMHHGQLRRCGWQQRLQASAHGKGQNGGEGRLPRRIQRSPATASCLVCA